MSMPHLTIGTDGSCAIDQNALSIRGADGRAWNYKLSLYNGSVMMAYAHMLPDAYNDIVICRYASMRIKRQRYTIVCRWPHKTVGQSPDTHLAGP